MNRIKFAAAVAIAVGCTVALSAQAVSGDKDKADQTRMSSPVTVTGCIAKGHEAGHYVLTNAVLTPETAPSAGRHECVHDRQDGVDSGGHVVRAEGRYARRTCRPQG